MPESLVCLRPPRCFESQLDRFQHNELGYALYYYNKLLSLEDVIESADAINHSIPNADKVSRAFLASEREDG